MSYIATSMRAAIVRADNSMLYKEVKPAIAFCNGQRLEVNQIAVTSISDNLINSVTFKYSLADKNGVFAGDGIFTLEGDAYPTWDATAAEAYRIVSEAIGLELLNA